MTSPSIYLHLYSTTCHYYLS